MNSSIRNVLLAFGQVGSVYAYVGNMLSSQIKTICVDINPSIVKLSDRGTSQVVEIVSNGSTFMSLLVNELKDITHPFR